MTMPTILLETIDFGYQQNPANNQYMVVYAYHISVNGIQRQKWTND